MAVNSKHMEPNIRKRSWTNTFFRFTRGTVRSFWEGERTDLDEWICERMPGIRRVNEYIDLWLYWHRQPYQHRLHTQKRGIENKLNPNALSFLSGPLPSISAFLNLKPITETELSLFHAFAMQYTINFLHPVLSSLILLSCPLLWGLSVSLVNVILFGSLSIIC